MIWELKTWEQLKEIVNCASIEVLGRTKSTSKPWFNKICEEATKRRKLTRQEWLGDINNNEILERYRCHRREINNILRCEKRKYVKGMIDGAEMEYRSNRTEYLYQRVKNLKGQQKTEVFEKR